MSARPRSSLSSFRRFRSFHAPAALALLLPAAAASAVAEAGEIRADGSKITAVTVYADRAEVTRTAEVRVPAGSSEIVLAGLPAGLDPDSLRASARGVPALLGAVELRREGREPERTPDFLAADGEVRKLEGELRAVEVEEQADREAQEFLRGLRGGASTGAKGDGAKLDLEGLRGVYGFVRTQLEELGRRGLARQERRRLLGEQLEVARARREAARPAGSVRGRAVAVAVEARQAGSLTVQLAYTVSGAMWRPSYRATLDADRSEVAFVAEAVVTQATGEDWEAVPLVLSTAAPSRGIEPPELFPITLFPYEPRPMLKSRAVPQGAGASADSAERMEAMAAAPPPPAPVEAEIETSAVLQSALNVSFAVPGSTSVPSDRREHRVTLRRDVLKAVLGYRVVAGRQAEAFVVAKTNSPADYPLLAGTVRVFSGAGFIGQFAVSEAGPGAELAIPFGIDTRIAVKRIALPGQRSREGFGNRDQQVVSVFRTQLENLRDVPATVEVVDQLPVSADERIVVRRGEQTTAGAVEDRDRPGVLTWTTTLAPREKRELVLEYSVRWPRELAINLP